MIELNETQDDLNKIQGEINNKQGEWNKIQEKLSDKTLEVLEVNNTLLTKIVADIQTLDIDRKISSDNQKILQQEIVELTSQIKQLIERVVQLEKRTNIRLIGHEMQ